MNKCTINHDQEFERIEKVLLLQKCPHQAIRYLKRLSGDICENGLTWVLIKVYYYGVITGKREERKRRNA